MLPETLCVQAFGPYVEEQIIDFTAYPSLFLIRGETGSGKTMILDAITYALYGKSSGSQREDLDAMRSRFAPDSLPTRLVFTFTLKGQRYRFIRSVEVKLKRNKERIYKIRGDAEKWEDHQFLPFFENPKLKAIEQKAMELIGLSHEQFVQVMVLPQGKFEQLLVSKSEEKQAILRTLFQMEKWEHISDYVIDKTNEKRREMDERKHSIEALWQSMQVSSEAQAQSEIADIDELIKQEGDQLKQLESQYEQALICYHKQVQLQDAYDKSVILEDQQATLALQQKTIQTYEQMLNAYHQVERLYPYYQQKQQCYGEYQRRGQSLKQAQEAYAQWSQKLADFKDWDQTKQQFLQHMEELQEHIQQIKTCEELSIQLQACEQQILADEQSLAQKKEACTTKARYVKQLNDQHDVQYQEYLTHSAYALRSLLKDDEPCPVCGSTQHPYHDTIKEQYVDVVQLKERKQQITCEQQQLESLQLEYSQMQASFQISLQQQKQLLHTYEQQCKDLIDQDGMQNDQGWKAMYNEQVALLKQITQVYEQTKELAHATLLKEHETKQQLQAADKEYQHALKRYELANAAYEEHNEQHISDEQLKDLPVITEIKRMQQAIIDYEKSLIELQTKQADLQLMLKEYTPLSLKTMEKDLKEQQLVLKKQQQQLASLQGKKQLFASIIEKGNKLQQEYEQQQPVFQRMVHFAKALRGDNSIGIERYVLGVLLSNITDTANQLLLHVHHGRYQLYRCDQASGRTRKSGLEFQIYDTYTCSMRNVVSLSGGEKFLVSLALSLALSSSVQARNGGIQFDCMFIDEGFGTLDEYSIADALAILDQMGRQKGMIGIISHVDLLKEHIPAGIEVVKTRNGSHIKNREEL